ncbi:isoaspartyl peptidase/L-asparaginase [Candidatus Bathyarchaeota archaeon]|nr:isoaspartyl peptidase/L-asparaginase [Candidatus Bathyarchaeota archaeon]
MVKPFLIGTRNAAPHLYRGIGVLKKGGSIIDAVEATVSGIEESTESGNVGVGGSPNILGVIELDASIMDGATMKTGAVGCVSKYCHAISIARKVMDCTPHAFLVADGAHRFAKVMGFKELELHTERSKTLAKAMALDGYKSLPDDWPNKEYYVTAAQELNIHEWYKKLSDEHQGTTNVIGMDSEGNICVGVSTSGTSMKFPGRIGDSPIIGAGNYCDNRYGGVACTGRGELTIRRLTSRIIIKYMEDGLSMEKAIIKAFKELHALKDGSCQCIAVDKNGNTISANMTRASSHFYMDIDMTEPKERQGILVEPD